MPHLHEMSDGLLIEEERRQPVFKMERARESAIR
jgi:hypothetical protein